MWHIEKYSMDDKLLKSTLEEKYSGMCYSEYFLLDLNEICYFESSWLFMYVFIFVLHLWGKHPHYYRIKRLNR